MAVNNSLSVEAAGRSTSAVGDCSAVDNGVLEGATGISTLTVDACSDAAQAVKIKKVKTLQKSEKVNLLEVISLRLSNHCINDNPILHLKASVA